MNKINVLNLAKIAKSKSIKYATSEARFLYLLPIEELEFLSNEKKHQKDSIYLAVCNGYVKVCWQWLEMSLTNKPFR